MGRDYTAGAYKLVYGAAGTPPTGGVDLGWSDEPPRISFFSGGEWQMISVDQFGSMPLDAIFKGVEQIRVTFASVNFTTDVLDVALRSVFDKALSVGGSIPLIPRYPAGTFAIKDSAWSPLLVTPYVEGGSLASWEFYFFNTHPVGVCDIPLGSARLKRLPMEFACLPTLQDISESGSAPSAWPDDATLIPNFGYIADLSYESGV